MHHFKLTTNIAIGSDSLDLLFNIKQKRVWIVCDSFLSKSDNLLQIIAILGKDNTVEVFSDVKPDPTVEDVANGVRVLSGFKPDVIIAYGGGSAIDLTKGIRYFGAEQGITIKEFIAIPTTSGTGSEVTNAVVISVPEKKAKIPLFDDSLLPDVAILDPNQTVTVPQSVTANTGIDVLTHAIEALVSVNADDFSDALAEKAVMLVFENLIDAYNNGDDVNSRAKLHHASCMAGMAFNHAGLGLTHAIAHQLGAYLHVPHGLANAITLVPVIEFNSQCNVTCARYARLARHLGLVSHKDDIQTGASRFVIAIKALCSKIGIAGDCQRLGVKMPESNDELNLMADAAMKDSTLVTNPLQPTCSDIKAILQSL